MFPPLHIHLAVEMFFVNLFVGLAAQPLGLRLGKSDM